MREEVMPLYKEAMIAKMLYNTGQISRDEAKERIQPYLDKANEIGKEIAKKYKGKHRDIGFIGFVR